MPRKKESKRDQLQAWLAAHPGVVVDERVFATLMRDLAPIGDSYLRELLHDSGATLSPQVEGVRLDSFEKLQRTLTALAELYEDGDASVRSIVLLAKQRARWASQNAKDERKRAEKEEMVEWLLVWLEHPNVFPIWAGMRRKRQMASATAVPPTQPE